MLRIYLTSRIALAGPAGLVDESALPGELGRLLVVRLVLRRHLMPRSELVEDLWPGDPPPAVESVLNATISRVRRALDSIGVEGRRVVVANQGLVEWRRPPDMWVDVEVAHRSVDRAEGALRRGEATTAWAEAVVASAVARRPLVPSSDRLWLDQERTRLSVVLERALAVLADVWLLRGDPEQSRVMAEELVRVAPLLESSHRRLVVALVAAGERAAAARAVERWDAVLEAELGLPPDGRLRALLDGRSR